MSGNHDMPAGEPTPEEIDRLFSQIWENLEPDDFPDLLAATDAAEGDDLTAELDQMAAGGGRVFTRKGGLVEIDLPETVTDLLAGIVSWYGLQVAGDSMLARRLLQPVYADDPFAEWEYRERGAPSMTEERTARVNTVLNDLTAGVFPIEHVDCWLKVTNDIRLLTLDDIEDDADADALEAAMDGSTPESLIALMATAIQSELLDLLS